MELEKCTQKCPKKQEREQRPAVLPNDCARQQRQICDPRWIQLKGKQMGAVKKKKNPPRKQLFKMKTVGESK